MVTHDEGDYDGGQEDGRPQGSGKMIYSENDPLGRLVIKATSVSFDNMAIVYDCSQIKLRGQLGGGSAKW